MHVLHISSPDINNAAGVLVYDLHKAFKKVSKSTLLLRKSDVKASDIISYMDCAAGAVVEKAAPTLFLRIFNRIIRALKLSTPQKFETDPDYYFFDADPMETAIDVNRVLEVVEKPDIIIAYFMQKFFSINDLYALQQKTGAPVFLFLMDMAYLTGGCHYAWDCNGYKNTCLNCPAILNDTAKNVANRNFRFTKAIVDRMNIVVIAASEQIYRQAKESTLFKDRQIEKTLMGVDSDIFYKKEMSVLREKYCIPASNFVILFGAVSQSQKRKGVSYLYEALQQLKLKVNVDDILLLSIGNAEGADDTSLLGYNTIKYGYIKDYNVLADMYNLANVFVSSSIQDAGPMMINQSIACGTPVVCFNIGVSQDLIIDKKTGYIAELYHPELLAEGIQYIYSLDSDEYEAVSNNCLELAKKKLNLDEQVEAFFEVIEKEKENKK